MSGVNNTTQRPYTCKALNGKTGSVVSVRLGPGFNSVPEEEWRVVKKSRFVKDLKAKGFLEFGEREDEDELTKAGLTKSKVKVSRSTAPKGADEILKQQADAKAEVEAKQQADAKAAKEVL